MLFAAVIAEHRHILVPGMANKADNREVYELFRQILQMPMVLQHSGAGNFFKNHFIQKRAG